MNSVLFSKKSDHWSTPSYLYDHLINDLHFIDPCPLYTDYNSPLNSNYRDKYIFINPPYSHISKWCLYAEYLSKLNNLVLLLIPARTDTKYFQQLLLYNHAIIFFIKGRLKFYDKGSAPFPSVLIILDKRYSGRSYNFGDLSTLNEFIDLYLKFYNSHKESI